MAGEHVCPRCQGSRCIRYGSSRVHRRFVCRDCRRTFAATLGTPIFRLHTPLPEIVRAIRIVLRRGSLRAAEEQTGHDYETFAAWIKRLGEHAEAITDLLARELELSEGELDEFWSFAGRKGGARYRASKVVRANPTAPASGGAA